MKMDGRRRTPFCCAIIAVIVILTLTPSSGQLPGDGWKPVPRHQSVTIFHKSPYSRQPLADRYGFGHFESPLINHIPGPDSHLLSSGIPPSEGCSLYKVGFTQDLFHQYVQFKESLPDLKEFTICLWTKFHNHSTDHPLFNYAVGDNPKAINAWVSNTERASYYSLSVAGHTFYRLNYPLRLNRWYHSCQSWNGKTGEWQVWINGERTGRGFHNRLVGHVIKGGGVAIAGQEQSQLGGLSSGSSAKASGGMIGEVTMLQLYGVALTAGKAHKDHKHHHVHHFDHNGAPLDATTPPPPAPQPQSPNSILIGGQLNPMLELNLGGTPQFIPAQLPNGLQINAQFVNGQFSPARTISEQLLNAQVNNRLGVGSARSQGNQFIKFPVLPLSNPTNNGLLLAGQLPSPSTIQFLESPFSGHALIKREGKSSKEESTRNKRDNPEKSLESDLTDEQGESKRQSKRGLVALSDGSIVDDGLSDGEAFEQSLLIGLAGLGENIPIQNIQKEKGDEREPAEAEVRAVMAICSGCSEEPFQKALVLSWRHSQKKLFNGAVHQPAVPACKSF